jgi:hypothetical protein
MISSDFSLFFDVLLYLVFREALDFLWKILALAVSFVFEAL